MPSDNCLIGFFITVRFVHMIVAITGLSVFLRSFQSPAREYMGGIEIAFVAGAGICVAETIVMGVGSLCFCKHNDFNPFHRFLFAAAVLGLAIALIIRTKHLDEIDSVPRCQLEWVDTTSQGRKGRTQNLVRNQQPCQIYEDRLAASVISLLSSVIYVVTGFKVTMRMRAKTRITPLPPDNGSSRAVLSYQQYVGYMAPPAAFISQQPKSVPFPRYNPDHTQFSRTHNYSYNSYSS